MAGRGRRTGYNNYSVQDQLLLCQLAESVVPIGRNMWEQVAAQYNAARTRNSPERDVDSLKRKFKSLYSKPKPTGQGEVSVRLRPVVWAQEIQQKIELSCGVQTSHDGPDDGEDDAAFETEVESVLEPPPQQHLTSDAGNEGYIADRDEIDNVGTDEPAPVDPDAEHSDPEVSLNAAVSDADTAPEDEPPTPDAISQYAQASEPPENSSQSTGVIMTSSGVIDVRLAPEFDFSADDEPVQEESQAEIDTEMPSTGPISREEIAVAGNPTGAADTGSTSRRNDSSARELTATRARRKTRGAGENPTQTPRRTSISPRTPSPRATTSGGIAVRGAGRPRTHSLQHIPTVGSHNGPVLQRNPSRVAADEREETENRSLNVASNRLGGQDLRVLRDNVEALTQSMLNENGKRSPTETLKNDGSASYAKTKRVRMQQRLDEMQKEMDEAESKRSGNTGEMMKLLLFFQKDTDRRAEAEERRRRSERDEHIEAERRERAERSKSVKRRQKPRRRDVWRRYSSPAKFEKNSAVLQQRKRPSSNARRKRTGASSRSDSHSRGARPDSDTSKCCCCCQRCRKSESRGSSEMSRSTETSIFIT